MRNVKYTQADLEYHSATNRFIVVTSLFVAALICDILLTVLREPDRVFLSVILLFPSIQEYLDVRKAKKEVQMERLHRK